MTSPAVSLTFSGGLRTPSGTRFVVSAGQHRAFFDLGMAFTPATNFFDGRVATRPKRVLGDLLALSLAPALPRISAPEALEADFGLPPGPDEHAAVFVSHLHLDHVSLLQFVAEPIPIYMSQEGAALVPRLEAAGLGSGMTRRRDPLAAGETVALGELRITLMPVDHDVPGAAGFLIDTPDGTLVYSGDLRTHGYRPEATEKFIAAAAAAAREPRALIIESTRMGEEPNPMLSEAEVIDEMALAASSSPGLVIVIPYPRNIERLERLPEVARRAGRRLVVETAIARLMGDRLPRDVVVYGDNALDREGVTANDIRADARRYFVQISYPQLANLIDLQPPPGSLLIHSDGEPIGPFDPAFANLQRWCDRFGVEHRVIRSSGHASPAELILLAAAVGAEVVFPVHGFRPDLLLLPGVRQVLPALNRPYGLDGLPASE